MSKPVLAAQLYTVRQFTQTIEEFTESIKKISQIGYRAVQVSGIGPIPNETVKSIVNQYGIKICNTHIGYELLWHDIQSVIEQHQLWDCRHVAIGSLPMEYRTGEDGFRRFAREASQVGERLAQAGLSFSYHNHSFEFAHFGEKTGLDIIFEESDPRFLQAEIDTYWVQHGGGDPVLWVRKMHNRMPVVHLKDMSVTAEGWNVQQIMTEIGEGNLNWQEILPACEETGVEWYAVEQDTCQRDPFESLKMSYENLRKMGLE